jgi:hypothetical protein
MYMRYLVALAAVLWFLPAGEAACAGHWSAPAAAPTSMHLAGRICVSGAPPQSGDELAVFGASSAPYGVFVFDKDGPRGFYGDLSINGDSRSAQAVSGAKAGETLTLRYWSFAAAREYSAGEVTLLPSSAFETAGYHAPPVTPLEFAPLAFYGVNVSIFCGTEPKNWVSEP